MVVRKAASISHIKKVRGKRLKKAFSDPLTEVHVYFYANALPLFTHYKQFLQRLNMPAHMVKPVTNSLTRKIGMRFLMMSQKKF